MLARRQCGNIKHTITGVFWVCFQNTVGMGVCRHFPILKCFSLGERNAFKKGKNVKMSVKKQLPIKKKNKPQKKKCGSKGGLKATFTHWYSGQYF